MDAGKLRYWIDIQDYTIAQNTNGDDIKTYNISPPFARVQANIISKGGRELYAAQQQFSEANAIIEIRYWPGVNDKMRVYHAAEGVYYDILNVAPGGLGRKDDMHLICKTGLSDEA